MKDSRVEYERNPYITTDKLICRLTNTHVVECGQCAELKFAGVCIQVSLRTKSSLIVANTSEDRSVILPQGFFQILNCETNTLTPLSEKKVLEPQSDATYQEFCLGQAEVIVINGDHVEGSYLFLL